MTYDCCLFLYRLNLSSPWIEFPPFSPSINPCVPLQVLLKWWMTGGPPSCVAYFYPHHQEKHIMVIFSQCPEPKCFPICDGKSWCVYSCKEEANLQDNRNYCRGRRRPSITADSSSWRLRTLYFIVSNAHGFCSSSKDSSIFLGYQRKQSAMAGT